MPLLTSTGKRRVILGLMTFGPDASEGARITSLSDFTHCLDIFQGAGYNEVDTAESYVGTKQQAFTRAAGWQSRGLKLATKYYPNAQRGGHDAANIRAKLEWNLRELGADCVDIFYLHAADRGVAFAETLAECDRLHREGKFVQLGLSNFAAFEVAECVVLCHERGWVRPTIYQGMLNCITRSLEAETVVACHRYGLDVVVYNPLAGGLLSGKIKSAEVPAEGRFSDASVAGERYRQRYFRDATFDALRILEAAAAEHGVTLLEIALRWVVHHSTLNMKDDGGDGLIIGVSSAEQLQANLRDLEKGPLPDGVLKAVDEAWAVAKAQTPPYWHGELVYTYDFKDALSKPKPRV